MDWKALCMAVEIEGERILQDMPSLPPTTPTLQLTPSCSHPPTHNAVSYLMCSQFHSLIFYSAASSASQFRTARFAVHLICSIRHSACIIMGLISGPPRTRRPCTAAGGLTAGISKALNHTGGLMIFYYVSHWNLVGLANVKKKKSITY